MNDPDNFLARWSRRKRENEVGDTAAEKPATQPDNRPPSPPDQTKPAVQPDAAGKPGAFDVASLPPIESIDADTDISAFLQRGVPTALRHAALRRAWSADPAIRDYLGPTENFWDAAGPDGIPGFGELDPGLDVKRMVAELFGETTSDKPPAEQRDSVAAPAQRDANPEKPADRSTVAGPQPQQSASQQSEIGAAQKPVVEGPPSQKMARRHGGAMPE